MPTWIGSIQENLYARFPQMRRLRQVHKNSGMELAVDPPDFDPTQPGTAFLFSNKDRQTSVQIHKGGVVVFTTNYLHFKEFLDDVTAALSAVLASSEFLEVETVGVRYLDFIQPKSGDKLNQYIDSRLLPFQPEWDGWAGAVHSGTSLNHYVCGDDRLSVRFTGPGYPVIPEDVALAYLANIDPEDAEDGMSPISMIEDGQGSLDIDASVHELDRRITNASDLEMDVTRLHSLANTYFRKICTAHAFSRWNEDRT